MQLLVCFHFDIDVHTSRHFQSLQSINGLGCGCNDIDQSLVRAILELLTAVLNTIFAWDTPLPDVVEPPLWFHDIFRSDGTPYSAEEVECIRSLTK